MSRKNIIKNHTAENRRLFVRSSSAYVSVSSVRRRHQEARCDAKARCAWKLCAIPKFRWLLGKVAS